MRRILVLLLALSPMLPAFAQPLAEGEVTRINEQSRRITIKHGPIPALDMPPMTMVFEVKDPAMLGRVKPGHKVRFQAEMLPGGRTVVTQIEKAR